MLARRKQGKEGFRRVGNATKSLERIKKIANKNQRNAPHSKSVGALNKVGQEQQQQTPKTGDSHKVSEKQEQKDRASMIEDEVGAKYHISDDGTRIDSVTTSSADEYNNISNNNGDNNKNVLLPRQTAMSAPPTNNNSDDMTIESLSRLSTANSTSSSTTQYQVMRCFTLCGTV